MSARKIGKVAIYSHSIAPSIDGVCRRFTGILHELERRGYDTLVFTLEDKPQDLPASTTAVTLDHMIIPSYPNKKVARPTFRSLLLIWQALNAYRPEVLHVVADGFSHMFAIVGLSMNIPVVGSFHTDILDLLDSHNAYQFQKWCVILKEYIDSYALVSCATTSKSFSEKLLLQGVSCDHIINTAVDDVVFNPSKHRSSLRREMTFGDDSGFLCVYVGRISNEKRLDIIIEAVKGLTGSKAYLAIVGDGPTAPQYASMHGTASGIYCQPRFLSHEELAEIYASCDLHVSASEFETLGNTVLEAFACGIPVVVPRTQGFKDTVEHSVNGFLFNPGDSYDAKRFIQKLKDNSTLRLEMGQNGRVAIQSRNIANVVRDLLHWYSLGKSRKDAMSFFRKFFVLLILPLTIPLAIILLNCYDILMNLLMMCIPTDVLFGNSDKSKTRKQD